MKTKGWNALYKINYRIVKWLHSVELRLDEAGEEIWLRHIFDPDTADWQVTVGPPPPRPRQIGWSCPHYSLTMTPLGGKPTAGCGCDMQPVLDTALNRSL